MADCTAVTGPLVSVIMPVYNAGPFLEEALASVASQTYRPLQLSVYNDASTDNSPSILESHRAVLEAAGVDLVMNSGPGAPKGCGYACNRAVEQATGQWLCFLDADDVMLPERVALQLRLATSYPHALTIHETPSEPPPTQPPLIVGCNLQRIPVDATPRYTAWLNRLDNVTLMTQRFRECTIAKPTWFMHRDVFDAVGGFDEGGRGVPEDLMFFYRHLELGGGLAKVPQVLLSYRRHPDAQSLGVPADTIWAVRLGALQRQVLSKWPTFSIWSAGRDGRRLYRDLPLELQKKVVCFLDVDAKKLALGHYFHHPTRRNVPVRPYTDAKPPFVTCVKLDLHDGFETNVRALGLNEGEDFYYFC